MTPVKDIIIIGSGISGLSAALFLADQFPVTIITKGNLLSGSTPLAQGGIAAVSNKDDSFDRHIEDTLKAGEYKNNTKAVETIVTNAPHIIDKLQQWGVEFEQETHLEGGHSFPRIFHCKDQTGKHIAETLAKKVIQHHNITIQENSILYSIKPDQKKVFFRNLHQHTSHSQCYGSLILSTGGYSSLFSASSSPKGNTGDGIATAIQAGIHVSDMSQVQFHPTVLKKERSPRLLLTEAIRGAGGKIVLQDGTEIVEPLLPRNVVSKAIWNAEQQGKEVFLDARFIENFDTQFPYIFHTLNTEFSINPQKDLIPITFGAHYCMGGITTGLYGETNITDIYAIGECAKTGVHGANRLASNSLLEGLVFAEQCSKKISTQRISSITKSIKKKDTNPDLFISSDKTKEKLLFTTLQNALSTHASIERNINHTRKLQEVITHLDAVSTREQNAICIAQSIINDLKNKYE